jgi:hypothetical protein
MASIIDPTIEQTGNPAEALKAAEQASTTATSSTQASTATQIPDRFKGKTVEEMYQIFANAEKRIGTLAHDLGQQRQMTDQLLQMKRENDLRANGATQQQQQAATAVTASDLLENPKQALDKYFEAKESGTVNELRQRLATQESLMAQTSFVTKHPDWQEHTNDPAFVEWARQTPWRSNLAASAAQNNLQAADALLTEYKAYQPLLRQTNESTNLAAARKVGLERSAGAGDATSQASGPIIRRRDSMALRISDPDRYESPGYQNALLAAIRDGRYKD